MSTPQVLDVLLIGGGPAGLSAAACLARLCHTAVVFDSGSYRNGLSSHMHVVPTWDHRDPVDFRAAARKDILARYHTIQFQDAKVESISRTENGLFKAMDATNREWIGRKVLLATGVKDIFPKIEGFEQCWVKGIFHCLFCHGYEVRGGQSAGVLAIDVVAVPMMAMHFALNATQLADSVTIYTNGSPDVFESIKAAAAPKASKIQVDDRKIKKLVKGDHAGDVIIYFEDGTQKLESFLVHPPLTEANGPFAKQLGLDLTPTGDYQVTPPFNETNVHGVFAAGDCSTQMKAVANATANAGFAAAGLSGQLEMEN